MKIILSGALRRFVNYQRDLTYNASTITAALHQMCSDYPDLGKVLFNSDETVSSLNRYFLNGTQMTTAELDTATTGEDTLDIITAIAGG
ncbi:MoaD/ThiS family protein [Nocardia sp. NPDC059240]|uniref:MoaD/ThiS family protein n=1 Tax=Nocardia sp. NPDC059240 TaxID=3346786 RepID=UPI0036808DFE